MYIPHADRIKLYAAARYLPSSTEKAVGLKLKVTTYVKDPAVAKSHPTFAFDEEYLVDYRAGIHERAYQCPIRCC